MDYLHNENSLDLSVCNKRVLSGEAAAARCQNWRCVIFLLRASRHGATKTEVHGSVEEVFLRLTYDSESDPKQKKRLVPVRHRYRYHRFRLLQYSLIFNLHGIRS